MMKRLCLSLFALATWASMAVAQVGMPWPGPGGVSALPAIGTPVSLGCVQGTFGTTTTTLTTTAAIPAGSLVVVGIIAGFGTTQTITGVSDGTNTYSAAVTNAWDATSNLVGSIWQKPAAAAVGSSASLTATYSGNTVGSPNVPTVCAAYVTGIIASTPLDKTNSGKTLPGTAQASGTTGTLTQANEIAFGYLGGFSSCTSVTEGSGFTTITPSPKLQGVANNWCGNLAFKTVAATTALNYQPTTSSAFAAAMIATFKGF